ncbi:MAG: DUF1573 domain-containing protein [Candidatus Taylorbacteria bacterium]|nr:DUF1573 domain-containing protein [Candidatus Taylorbacteria bacterium]
MKPKITIIFGALSLIAILFALGYVDSKGANTASVQGVGGSHPAKAESQLVAQETLYDFGTISMKNGLATKEFTVANPTDTDVTVRTLLTSCMCTNAYLVKPNGAVKGPFGMPGMGYVPPVNERIKAGESRVIRVVYDPNAHGPAGVGRIDRFVILTEEDGDELQLEIIANVTP